MQTVDQGLKVNDRIWDGYPAGEGAAARYLINEERNDMDALGLVGTLSLAKSEARLSY